MITIAILTAFAVGASSGCAAAAIAMTVWEPKPRQRVDVWPAGLD
jgi:hypothetical protein